MKYSLDVNIISIKQDVLDALKAALPLPSDAKVWIAEYSLEQIIPIGDGVPALVGSIRFHESVDRDAILQAVIDVEGIFPQCEVGSYIRLTNCFHDEVPPKPCTAEVIYEVIP